MLFCVRRGGESQSRRPIRSGRSCAEAQTFGFSIDGKLPRAEPAELGRSNKCANLISMFGGTRKARTHSLHEFHLEIDCHVEGCGHF